ncbi:formate dehydrogenase accessory protein FdhE [Rhizobium sp. ARZ01]|uniref:formate dehydrogenase accessory protein FdhE n=1 Tax=Rhizobium sp. ARZ01 TaxID=2769313 RepID=UPI0017821997|nr:formate dehydrogenase accessory protein FdhE [Rhizobium sp. ARZ01]MBD9375059.1 formate dehydrogenase accessory protein FdhE [Rhizobium sp. ARZ01]
MTGKTELTPDPTVIGDVSSPPFVRLPEPSTLFTGRAARLRQLAELSPLKSFLVFVAALTDAQGLVELELPPAQAPDPDAINRAREFGMPLIDRHKAASDGGLERIFDRLFAEVAQIEMPQDAATALAKTANAGRPERLAMVDAIFTGALPPDAIAEHIYVWAGLQLHFSHLASVLDPKTARPVADGLCPICGSLPSASMVVGWPGARFCACSLCNSMWHYVRIKCTCCGSTKGIGYKEVEGGDGVVKAETCDECQSWTKIIYQQKSSGAEPIADDVGSLGIDLLMRAQPYHRGGFSPLLAGL